MRNVKEEKARIRQQVWRALEDTGVARFPRPVYGRIPNFDGAETAAQRLISLSEFADARVVKVNPDAPQRMVRFQTLSQGKMLITPTPRMKEGFLLLNPRLIPKRVFFDASSITGSFKHGRRVDLADLPKVNLIVLGSVAVSPSGGRLGKGGGYGEIEYGILRELGLVDDNLPVLTTVHDLQIVEDIPVEEHDVPVDVIVTPTKIIRTHTFHSKPQGIIWDRLTPDMWEEIPVLKILYERRFKASP